jgi:hypothetical protein
LNTSERINVRTSGYNARETCRAWLTSREEDEAYDTLDALYACVEQCAEDTEYWAICFLLDDLITLLSGEATKWGNSTVASEVLAYTCAHSVLPCSDLLPHEDYPASGWSRTRAKWLVPVSQLTGISLLDARSSTY